MTDVTPLIIDAHQHVWNLERADYPWLGADLTPIDRSVGLDDVRPELRAAGVGATILVQAADSDDDTDNMLDVAHRSPEVVGVVAWVPLDDADRAAERLELLRRDPLVVGVRALTHDYPDPAWLLRREVGAGLTLLEALDVPFDFVASSHHALALIPAISQQHPALRIVIDHLAKPPLTGSPSELADWEDLLAEAAQNPCVSAKISGLYGPADDPGSWTISGMRRVVAYALDVFGSGRLMYGGDWPISVLAGGYSRVWEALSTIFRDLGAEERVGVTSETARQFYRLDPGIVHRARRLQSRVEPSA